MRPIRNCSTTGGLSCIGGLDTVPHPARVFSRPVGDPFHHGLLGMDLLYKARQVTIDFRAMTVVLK